jgi:mono/diheme cytochrome c family protein
MAPQVLEEYSTLAAEPAAQFNQLQPYALFPSKGEYMKLTFLQRAALFAVGVFLAVPVLAAAEANGADLYKAKCAMCHGADGAGKMGPALKGTSLSEAQIQDQLLKGAAGKKAPHSKPMTGLTEDQAKAVASYVKTLN